MTHKALFIKRYKTFATSLGMTPADSGLLSPEDRAAFKAENLDPITDLSTGFALKKGPLSDNPSKDTPGITSLLYNYGNVSGGHAMGDNRAASMQSDIFLDKLESNLVMASPLGQELAQSASNRLSDPDFALLSQTDKATVLVESMGRVAGFATMSPADKVSTMNHVLGSLPNMTPELRAETVVGYIHSLESTGMKNITNGVANGDTNQAVTNHGQMVELLEVQNRVVPQLFYDLSKKNGFQFTPNQIAAWNGLTQDSASAKVALEIINPEYAMMNSSNREGLIYLAEIFGTDNPVVAQAVSQRGKTAQDKFSTYYEDLGLVSQGHNLNAQGMSPIKARKEAEALIQGQDTNPNNELVSMVAQDVQANRLFTSLDPQNQAEKMVGALTNVNGFNQLPLERQSQLMVAQVNQLPQVDAFSKAQAITQNILTQKLGQGDTVISPVQQAQNQQTLIVNSVSQLGLPPDQAATIVIGAIDQIKALPPETRNQVIVAQLQKLEPQYDWKGSSLKEQANMLIKSVDRLGLSAEAKEDTKRNLRRYYVKLYYSW